MRKIGFLVSMGLIWALPWLACAEETSISLPNGKILPTRKIYSSPNRTDHLIEAIAVKDVKKIEDLIAEGVNINSAGSSGETPLMEALGDDKAEILDLLLSHGIDVNLTATIGELEMAPLELAISSGHEASVKKLLAHGAKIEREDMLGETVLFNAVRSGNAGITKLLIDHGADINHKNRIGDTPLSLAEKSGNHRIVEILKKNR